MNIQKIFNSKLFKNFKTLDYFNSYFRNLNYKLHLKIDLPQFLNISLLIFLLLKDLIFLHISYMKKENFS